MPDISQSVGPNDEFEMFLENKTRGPIYDIGVKISPFSVGGNRNDPAYKAGPFVKIFKLPRGVHLIRDLTLPYGHYRVEISTDNDYFIQSLKIAEIRVRKIHIKDGFTDELLYSTSPRPVEF